MLEIPARVWKKIPGFAPPQKVYRTNSEQVLCWKTVHLKEQRPIVIKLFLWNIIEDARAELDAANAIKEISHPNLVEILTVKQQPDLGVYYVMEYWGEDLRETVRIRPHARKRSSGTQPVKVLVHPVARGDPDATLQTRLRREWFTMNG